MNGKTNYTIVGIFVICLITAIVLAIIWLSSGFSFEHYTTYLVNMQESVSGLNIDSAVEYNGVNVGSVKDIELNPKAPKIVELLLSVKNSTPITRGTVATLATRGLTGLVYVALKDKNTDLHKLIAKRGEPYPIIPTAPSIFVRLDTALTQLNDSFHQISQSIQSVLDKDNQKSIKNTLTNLQVVTKTLADNSKKLTDILTNTSRASQQLTPLIQESNNTIRLLKLQTLPAIYQLLSNMDTVTRTLNDVSSEIKRNPSVLIRGTTPNTPGPGEKQ